MAYFLSLLTGRLVLVLSFFISLYLASFSLAAEENCDIDKYQDFDKSLNTYLQTVRHLDSSIHAFINESEQLKGMEAQLFSYQAINYIEDFDRQFQAINVEREQPLRTWFHYVFVCMKKDNVDGLVDEMIASVDEQRSHIGAHIDYFKEIAPALMAQRKEVDDLLGAPLVESYLEMESIFSFFENMAHKRYLSSDLFTDIYSEVGGDKLIRLLGLNTSEAKIRTKLEREKQEAEDMAIFTVDVNDYAISSDLYDEYHLGQRSFLALVMQLNDETKISTYQALGNYSDALSVFQNKAKQTFPDLDLSQAPHSGDSLSSFAQAWVWRQAHLVEQRYQVMKRMIDVNEEADWQRLFMDLRQDQEQ